MRGAHDRRPRWEIADVLDRTDLADLLDELAETSGRLGAGRRWHCPMPEHDDRHPSVTMHRDHRGHERWRCWSADHRGDAIDLVMVTTGRDRLDAIEWLAGRAGMIPDRPLPPLRPKTMRPAPPAAAELNPLVERYVTLCQGVLRGPQGAPVLDWLQARGISSDTIVANRLGADPGRQFLRRRRGLPYGAGIAAVLPALDPTGRLAYVQARYIEPDTAGRKYDNPAASLAPHPRLAYPAATGERAGRLLVCEGLPDALIAAQAGYRTVALLGAQTPDDTVAARIANHAANHDLDVAIVRDADAAGCQLADTLTAVLHGHGIDAEVVTPPGGCDLNAWALAAPDWAVDLDLRLGVEPVNPPGNGIEL